MGFTETILSIFNVIFWLVGGAMLGVGIWIVVDDETFGELQALGDDWYWEASLYIIMSVGAFIFIVAIVGCLGACTHNNFILILYSVFVSLAIVAEITAIAFIAVLYTNIYEIQTQMTYDVRYEYVNEYSNDPVSKAWNKMQIQWECCGSYSYNSYEGSNFQRRNPGVEVPWTCCRLRDGVSYKDASKSDVIDYPRCQSEAKYGNGYNYLNYRGCSYEVEDLIKLATPITLGILSGFVVIQFIGIAMSCVVRKKNRDVAPGKMI